MSILLQSQLCRPRCCTDICGKPAQYLGGGPEEDRRLRNGEADALFACVSECGALSYRLATECCAERFCWGRQHYHTTVEMSRVNLSFHATFFFLSKNSTLLIYTKYKFSTF